MWAWEEDKQKSAMRRGSHTLWVTKGRGILSPPKKVECKIWPSCWSWTSVELESNTPLPWAYLLPSPRGFYHPVWVSKCDSQQQSIYPQAQKRNTQVFCTNVGYKCMNDNVLWAPIWEFSGNTLSARSSYTPIFFYLFFKKHSKVVGRDNKKYTVKQLKQPKMLTQKSITTQYIPAWCSG